MDMYHKIKEITEDNNNQEILPKVGIKCLIFLYNKFLIITLL